MSSVTDKRIVDYFVPVLLTALLGVLGWIGSTLQSMNQALAVAVFRIDAIEKTEQHLEWRVRRLESKETDRPEYGSK